MKTIPMPNTKERRAGHSLAHIQRLMLDAVRRPLTADEGMQPKWSDGSDTSVIAQTIIKPNDRLTSFHRLEIYNQQYWWRLQGALQEDFRGLRAVIGDKKFDALVIAYLNEHPSRRWTLRDLGSQMPAFVESHPELIGQKTELALDVARIEWARIVAYDDPALPLLDAAELAEGGGDLQIRLQPYLQLIEVHHPVDQLMVKLKKREEQSAANSASHRSTSHSRRLSVARCAKPIFLAVHRMNNSLYYKHIEPEAHRLLSALRDGQTLEEACATAFAKSRLRAAGQAGKVREWFSTWTEVGWLCSKKKSD